MAVLNNDDYVDMMLLLINTVLPSAVSTSLLCLHSWHMTERVKVLTLFRENEGPALCD